MLERWFLAHPREVEETYFAHQSAALSFAAQLFAAAGACFVHALVPGLFQNTGSRTIARLHERMITKRVRNAPEIERSPETAVRSSLFRSDV